MTVDLDEDLYHELDTWLRSTAATLGQPRLPKTEAITAMIRTTLTRPDVTRHVTRTLRDQE